MNILVNTGATLDITFEGGAADGAVAVAVQDAAGHAVAAGAATRVGATAEYTYKLAPQAAVASLTISWAGVWGGVAQTFKTSAEIVGAHLFTLAELRTFDDQKLADPAVYPDWLLAEHRDAITDLFERVCGVSFIPRYQRDILAGDGGHTLWVTKRRTTKLLAATVDTVALNAGEIAAVDVLDGRFVRSDAWWPPPSFAAGRRNITVEYEHGYTFPPGRVGYAAKILARYEIVTSDLSDRSLSVAVEGGVVRLSTPGAKYPTGIPTVDAELDRWTIKASVL